MLKLIIKQANWGILGAIFGFSIGFLVKIYLIEIVGIASWGKYVSAHTFTAAVDTFLSIGMPFVLIKFIPNLLQDNSIYTSQLIRKCLRYTVKISVFSLVAMYFLAPYFDTFIYKEIDNFSFILFLVSIHAPISIFTAIITSLYRSVFKIKEIMLYSTFIVVPLRAFLTFFTFQYTSNIVYFVGIELFTTSLSMFLLYYFFNKNEFNLFSELNAKEYNPSSEIINYGKKMYANSVIAFFAIHSLSLVLSIMLPSEQIGVYSILLSITAVSLFLIKNLNKIFSPAISKLYQENNFIELNNLYKTTTFIVNLLTLPFTILIMFFAKDILLLYDNTGGLIQYKSYLYFIMGARIIALFSGSSGSFMVMAGLEKYELKIQLVKAILITFLGLLLIGSFGLLAIVFLFVFFMLFVNVTQLIIIKKYLNISPFSKPLFILIFISIPISYFSITHQIEFNLYHYIIIPILLYLFYGLVFLKQIKLTIKEISNND